MFTRLRHAQAALLALLLLTLLLLAPALAADSGSPTSFVLEGGTVHGLSAENPSAEPQVTSVWIEDGMIKAVGDNLQTPTDTLIVDVSELHVYPGMLDAFSRTGLVEVSAVSATVDTTELGRFNPHLQAATAIHPASEVIPVTRANGITHALTAPATARNGGVIAGQAALIHLDGWTVEEMAIDDSIAMIITWPGIQTRSFDFSTFSFRSTPFADAKKKAEAAQNELRDWLDAARHYAMARAAGDAQAEAAGDRPRAGADAKLEALANILDGGQRVAIKADAKRDIEAAMAFAAEQDLRMVLVGGRDGWMIAEAIAEADIPVILGTTLSLPNEEDDAYDQPFRNPGILSAAGVDIAFGSSAGGGFGPGGPHGARTLPYEAAMAVAFGLPQDQAIHALTAGAAEILGIGDRLGSIEPGKIANVIVTDGDPMEITTKVEHLIIDGRQVSTANKHRDLYERYRSRPAQLESASEPADSE